MEKNNLSNFVNGWFIGDFEPSLFKTNNFEVAVKKYKIYDCENFHYHKISTEYTVIVSGNAEMNGAVYKEGDIIMINPGESTNFKCLTDVTTVVVKTPSSKNDKFIN